MKEETKKQIEATKEKISAGREATPAKIEDAIKSIDKALSRISTQRSWARDLKTQKVIYRRLTDAENFIENGKNSLRSALQAFEK